MWQFGEVEFDEAEGKLSVSGQAVELDRNCRAILITLLRQAGTDVSKEQLLEAGWPNRIVHENSLAKAIGRLRQVLGGQGDALETVYGYGYKLNVRVSRTEATAPGEPAAEDLAVAAASGTKRRSSLALVWIALLMIAGIGGAIVLSQPSSDAAVPFRNGPPIIGDAPDVVGRLLWVDDHPQNNVFEARFFQNHRIAVHNVTGSADALRLLSMYHYDIVISDMGRGEDRLAGLKLASQMRARGDETPLIIYTVRPDGADAQQAQREMAADAGAQGVVVTPQEVRSVVLKLFDSAAARASR